MRAEENHSRCSRRAPGLSAEWQRQLTQLNRNSTDGHWASKIWSKNGSCWIRIRIRCECHSVDLRTNDLGEAACRARLLQAKLSDHGLAVGISEFEREIARHAVLQNSYVAVPRSTGGGWLSSIILSLVARILDKVLAKVGANGARLVRVEQLLAKIHKDVGSCSPEGGFEEKIDDLSQCVEGFDRKLDEIQKWQCRFRPDAVWTLEEAAGELRMSPNRLREHVYDGDIKPMVRKKGKTEKRGERGGRIAFLYEEIQRFKGYRS